MGKLPGFTFYPGDWLRDHVSGCSLAAQGLWLRMMILGHDSDRYGYLSMNGKAIPAESIARRCGCTLPQYLTLLGELDDAGVPSRTPEGVLYSRRMVRDQQVREQTKERVNRFRNGAVTRRYENENEGLEVDVGSKKTRSKICADCHDNGTKLDHSICHCPKGKEAKAARDYLDAAKARAEKRTGKSARELLQEHQ